MTYFGDSIGIHASTTAPPCFHCFAFRVLMYIQSIEELEAIRASSAYPTPWVAGLKCAGDYTFSSFFFLSLSTLAVFYYLGSARDRPMVSRSSVFFFPRLTITTTTTRASHPLPYLLVVIGFLLRWEQCARAISIIARDRQTPPRRLAEAKRINFRRVGIRHAGVRIGSLYLGCTIERWVSYS